MSPRIGGSGAGTRDEVASRVCSARSGATRVRARSNEDDGRRVRVTARIPIEIKVQYDDNDDHPRLPRTGIAWPARDLDRGLPPRGPAGVRPRLLLLAGAGGLRLPALGDRRARHLHDLSPAADPPELRDPAEVARIRADGHRLLRLGGGADRLGRRPPPPPRPLRRGGRRPQPEPRLRLGPHVLVDDPRHHRRSTPPNTTSKWAPDLLKDPVHRLARQVSTSSSRSCWASALYAIGGMPWLVWGCFVRSVLVLHSTWLVNSATHVWGYRSHETRDNSTNLWWVALLTYGEGWHNNHHAFQTSARHGLRWWEVDMTYIGDPADVVASAWPARQAAQGDARRADRQPERPPSRRRRPRRPRPRRAGSTTSPNWSAPPTEAATGDRGPIARPGRGDLAGPARSSFRDGPANGLAIDGPRPTMMVARRGPSSTAEQGTHQMKWWRRGATSGRDPGELRET